MIDVSLPHVGDETWVLQSKAVDQQRGKNIQNGDIQLHPLCFVDSWIVFFLPPRVNNNCKYRR
jgi:hypothetical protein